MNLHNLVVADSHLAEFVFGTGLALIIMAYLVVLPFLYGRAGWIKRLTDFCCIPLPGPQIAILAVVATLFCAWIDLERQWEVYEFAFSVFVCLIFLAPRNGHAFGFTAKPGSDRQSSGAKHGA